jgi:hypothetical protein
VLSANKAVYVFNRNVVTLLRREKYPADDDRYKQLLNTGIHDNLEKPITWENM